MEKPHQEAELEEEVEGNEGENESSKLVQEIEQAEDDPIGQPLLIVVFALRLQSQKAHKNGVGNAQERRDVGRANAEHDEYDAKAETVP